MVNGALRQRAPIIIGITFTAIAAARAAKRLIRSRKQDRRRSDDNALTPPSPR